MQEDVDVLELGNHLVGIGDEVGGEVAAVELHALDDVEFGVERLGFFNRDDAFIADLLHGLGDHLANVLLAIGGDGANLADFFGALDLLRALLDVLDGGAHSEIDAALQIHRVHAGGNRLRTFAHDRLSEHAGRGGAVARDVIRLGGDFAQHLGAHILELVFEFDFLSDRHTVLGGARRAERLVDHDITALGA